MITLVCTSNVIERVDGFLRSTMLNLAPGVYVSDIDSGSRRRIWAIISNWWWSDSQGSMILLYPDKYKPMGVAMEMLGTPKREIIEIDGIYATIRSTQVEAQPNQINSENNV